jgi:iron complex transport system substrate-binding protein
LDRVADVRALIAELGALTGLGDRAGELVAEMDATLDEIQRRVTGRPRVRVAYILGGSPPWVAGPGTFIDELLATAGGENSFSDLEALYGPVSPEEFLVREIDLLLAPEGGEVFLSSDRVPLVRVSPALELPGPDLAQAAWELAKLLHPEVFR